MDDRVLHRIRTHEVQPELVGIETDACADPGGAATTLWLRRMLSGNEYRLWQLITDPAQLATWSPCVPDRAMTSRGPVTLRENPHDEPMPGVVEVARAPHELVHTWAADTLEWRIAGGGPIPAASPSAMLSLRHRLGGADADGADRVDPATLAAGWHVCLAVADLRLSGIPVARVVGRGCLDYGWDALCDRYRALLGDG